MTSRLGPLIGRFKDLSSSESGFSVGRLSSQDTIEKSSGSDMMLGREIRHKSDTESRVERGLHSGNVSWQQTS